MKKYITAGQGKTLLEAVPQVKRVEVDGFVEMYDALYSNVASPANVHVCCLHSDDVDEIWTESSKKMWALRFRAVKPSNLYWIGPK